MVDENTGSESKDRIVEAARHLFVNKGYNGTSVRDIAAASGVNVAMVNYYFRSKHELFISIFEESFNVLASRLFSAIDSDLPFLELIRKWVYSYIETLSEYPQLPMFVLTELTRNPDLFVEKLKLKDPYHIYSRMAIRMDEEEKKGNIRKIPVSNFLLSIVSLSIFPFIARPAVNAFLNLSDSQYESLLKDHKEYVVDFVINAIKIKG